MGEYSPLDREQLALCAHDLRGSLTVISGYVSLLRREDLADEERLRALDGIETAITRADSLVGDTLAGRPLREDTRHRVSVGELAERAAQDCRAATGRDVLVSVSGDPAVLADEIALARVLENLLSNAAKYAPSGPLEISAARSGDRVIVDVSDRGPGIPEAERASIFDPFARLPRDADLPGTGLGLTVVRSVVQAAGGSVSILDRDGGGAVVRLDLASA